MATVEGAYCVVAGGTTVINHKRHMENVSKTFQRQHVFHSTQTDRQAHAHIDATGVVMEGTKRTRVDCHHL